MRELNTETGWFAETVSLLSRRLVAVTISAPSLDVFQVASHSDRTRRPLPYRDSGCPRVRATLATEPVSALPALRRLEAVELQGTLNPKPACKTDAL